MRFWLTRRATPDLARSEGGTALVEFALLAPVFVFLLVGLIEIGRYTYFALLTANAVRAGVQYGAQNTITADDETGMQSAASLDGQALPAGAITFTATHICYLSGTTTACPNTAPQANWVYFVQVNATGSVNSIFRYPGIPQSIPITAKAVMRVASQ